MASYPALRSLLSKSVCPKLRALATAPSLSRSFNTNAVVRDSEDDERGYNVNRRRDDFAPGPFSGRSSVSFSYFFFLFFLLIVFFSYVVGKMRDLGECYIHRSSHLLCLAIVLCCLSTFLDSSVSFVYFIFVAGDERVGWMSQRILFLALYVSVVLFRVSTFLCVFLLLLEKSENGLYIRRSLRSFCGFSSMSCLYAFSFSFSFSLCFSFGQRMSEQSECYTEDFVFSSSL